MEWLSCLWHSCYVKVHCLFDKAAVETPKGGIERCKRPLRNRFEFKLYDLDDVLHLGNKVTNEKVLEAVEGHVIEEAVLPCIFSYNQCVVNYCFVVNDYILTS
ncbi:uncharacterized protein [Euphorbia lathyris]